MPQTTFVASILALAGSLAGCGTYATETWLKEPEARSSAERRHRVELYATFPPTRPHEDVALIEVEQTHGLNNRGTALMISRLLEKAEAMGCDAVFVNGIRERASGAPDTAWSLLDPGATTLLGVCVVYQTDETVGSFREPTRDGPRRSPAPLAVGARQRRDAEDPR